MCHSFTLSRLWFVVVFAASTVLPAQFKITFSLGMTPWVMEFEFGFGNATAPTAIVASSFFVDRTRPRYPEVACNENGQKLLCEAAPASTGFWDWAQAHSPRPPPLGPKWKDNF